VNQSVTGQPIIDRALGVLQLNDATYEEIEHDSNATVQAAIIVIVAGLAAGIGAIGDEWYSIIVNPIAQIIGWIVGSVVIMFVGTRIIPSGQTQADLGQVLRLLGFASVAGIANVLGFIPVVGGIIAFIAGIWGLVMTIKGIMHALEMSIGRAIATALLAWVAIIIVGAIFVAIFGVGLAGTS
jgi:hypothetical protein